MVSASLNNIEMFSSGEMNISQSHLLRNRDAVFEKIDLVKHRSTPEVVIMGKNDEILFLNHREISPLTLLSGLYEDAGKMEAERFRGLLSRLRRAVIARERLPAIERPMEAPTELFSFRGSEVSCRGLLLKGNKISQEWVMILIEKVKSSAPVMPLQGVSPYFTPREKSVLTLIKKGYTNKEIACALDIGVHTVKDHLKRIMKKVDVHTRAGIVGKLNGA